jgi:hypothetical protein
MVLTRKMVPPYRETVSGPTASRPYALQVPQPRPRTERARQGGPIQDHERSGSGYYYFGLSKNGSYDAAARGEIPFFQVGRLKRVSVAKMERMMEEGAHTPPPPPSIETPVRAVAKKPATPSKYPRSTAVRRRAPALADAS